MKRINMKPSSIILLAVMAFSLSGCSAIGHLFCAPNCDSVKHNSSSLVGFLYPNGTIPPREDAIPELRVPLRVGLAFLPSSNGDSAAGLEAARREELLQRIRARFADRKFVSEIVFIPDYYLSTNKGFAGLEGVQRLYNVDVMALVSYDQVTHLDDNEWSLGYLTIVGAYVMKGSRHDVSTLIDLAVIDPATRSLVLRAGGTDTRHGNSTLLDQERETRVANTEGFAMATNQMIENFDVALKRFESDVRAGKANVRVVNRSASNRSNAGGGGAFEMLWIVLLASICAIGYLFRRRNRHGSFALLTVGATWGAAASSTEVDTAKPAFEASARSDDRSLINYSLGNATSVGGPMFLMCQSAAHTQARQFEYFGVEKQIVKAKGIGTLELRMFHQPPKSSIVVDFANVQIDPGSKRAVFDAASVVAACRQILMTTQEKTLHN